MSLPKSLVLLAVLMAFALSLAVRAQKETRTGSNLAYGSVGLLSASSGGEQSTFAVGDGARSPAIVQALIRNGGTSLQLRRGKIYFYGLVTGGALPTSQFAAGQYVQAVDSAGQLAAALAYGINDRDSYDTETAYHAIGGLSVAGSWNVFDAFVGSNQQSGASFASVRFTVPCDSLVLVIGLASSQQSISLGGVPGLHVDALNRGDGTEAMIIAHAYLPSGVYLASEISAATAAGQDPAHMVDLIGVFVLGAGNGRLDAGDPNSNYSIDTKCSPLSVHHPPPHGISKRQCTPCVSAASSSSSTPIDLRSASRPRIVQWIIQPGGTSLQLSPGRMYLYGMATGGARPSSQFEVGQFAEAINRGGLLAAELAYGTDDHNQFSTTTYNHVIGGVSVTGMWNDFNAFYGSNSQPGVSSASVDFTVAEDALTVFIGLAGGQSSLTLEGIPGLQVDGSSSVKDGVVPVVIAHAYLQPGRYTVTGLSSIWPGEPQDTPPKGDLIGVFVFGSKNEPLGGISRNNSR